MTRGQGRIDRELPSAKDALGTAKSGTGKPPRRCGFSKLEFL